MFCDSKMVQVKIAIQYTFLHVDTHMIHISFWNANKFAYFFLYFSGVPLNVSYIFLDNNRQF